VRGNAEILAGLNAKASIAGVAFTDTAALATAAQVRWYAVYTFANHERRVADQLASRGVEHFLPQYESVRWWKDRKVRLQLPLFPGYLFVHLAAQERLRVLHVPGVVRLVGFDGSPTPMPEEDLERIREFVGRGWHAEPHPYLPAGRRVRVVCGPLAGMAGIVLRRKNRSRLVLSFDLIQRSVAIEMEEGDLVAI
jgi:transcription antitermination factor NusG